MCEHSFVFLAATSYGTCLSGRTRSLAQALAHAGQRVTFVEVPSLKNTVTGRFRFGAYQDGAIRVVRLPPLPKLVRKRLTPLEPFWMRFAARCLREWIPDLAQANLVTSTPWWAGLIDHLPRRRSCYDYIDHVSVHAFTWNPEQFAAWDEKLLRLSDLVLTVSQPLATHLAARFPAERITLVPNGVRSDWIDSPTGACDRGSITPRPEQPLVGFVGAMFEWIDQEMIAAVARLMPDVQFVFVGPTRRQVPLDTILALPNVRHLGPVPVAQVPAILKAFDVCTIPFKQDIVSKCADPLKIYEYCALGRPVVSTVAFMTGEPAPLMVADTPERFAAAVRECYAQDSTQRRAERLAFARRHTWEARADAMLKAFDGAGHCAAM